LTRIEPLNPKDHTKRNILNVDMNILIGIWLYSWWFYVSIKSTA